jgi:hypothetical protein
MVVPIALTLFGVLALVKGGFRVTPVRRVSPVVGRTLGALMLCDALFQALMLLGLLHNLGHEWWIFSLVMVFGIAGLGLIGAEKVEPTR